MEWTKENTLLLLKLIRERPVIWDATVEEHKYKQNRLDALSEIAKIFNLTTDEIYAKWVALKGQYNRENRKMAEPKRGRDPDDLYVSKWFAYQEMTDLMGGNSPQHSISKSTFLVHVEGWNRENTLLLLKLIRERPVIWDTTMEEHKNKKKRLDALSEIAKILNLTKHEIYTKWMALRGQYTREKRKMAEPKKGREHDALYVSKWFAYQEMADMMADDSPQHSISNSTDDVAEPSCVVAEPSCVVTEPPCVVTVPSRVVPVAPFLQYVCFVTDPKTAPNAPVSDTVIPRQPTPPAQHPHSRDAQHQLPQNSNDQFPESFLAANFIAADHEYESTDTRDTSTPNPSNKRKRTISDEKSNDAVPNDEFEVYARYVASELRQTGDPHSVLMAKHHINNILFNTRMGKYRRDSATDTQEVAVVEGCVKI